MIDGLTAIHDGDRVWRGRQQIKEAGDLSRSEHPVVRIHPVTGRRALFINSNFTEHIVGLSRFESDAILDMRYRHAECDDFKCRFKWRPNSIALWDNRMHDASGDVGLLSAEAVWPSGDCRGDEAATSVLRGQNVICQSWLTGIIDGQRFRINSGPVLHR